MKVSLRIESVCRSVYTLAQAGTGKQLNPVSFKHRFVKLTTRPIRYFPNRLSTRAVVVRCSKDLSFHVIDRLIHPGRSAPISLIVGELKVKSHSRSLRVVLPGGFSAKVIVGSRAQFSDGANLQTTRRPFRPE
jgi:hypothetical protein